jgi:Fanconi anemia group M protein
MLRDFTPRLYQETIFATAALKNTLVVLPTGLGKTAVGAMLAAQRLRQYPESKIIFLAPTKPLAEQHVEVFKRHLDVPEEKFALFTGAVAPEKRVELWKNAQIIIGTPQGLENDLLGSRLDVTHVSLMIFDEAHHATGDYSYCFIAKHYQQKAQFPRILGLTASPGSDLEKIREICKNLFIEAVEVRTFEDQDVAPYVKPIDTQWIKVDLPDAFVEIQRHLLACYQSKLKMMKELGYLNTTRVLKRDLLELQRQLHAEIAQGNKEMALLRSISLLAEAVKVQHALELVETQGVAPLSKYLQKLESEARMGQSKAVKNLVVDADFKAAYIKTMSLAEGKVQHPKLVKLREVVENELTKPDVKIIIFTQYRDSAVDIVNAVGDARLFVGQTKKGETGLTQKKQKEMLDAFRAHEFRVLVCTSVGEEGLDIPAVDLVVFYEPIPSAIRHIQRRGRTGRQEIGRVLIFMTNGTRDAAYRWVAHHKEKRMYRTLETLKKEFVLSPQPVLSSYIPTEQKVQVVTDYREKGSDVMKALVEMGVSLQLEKLDSADYLCSAQCAIEFKTVEDFVNSLVDGRLIEQLKGLKSQFQKPLVIVQGEQDIYSVRKVHPNAIRGMLATIAVGFGIPIIQTKNAAETAALIAIIAKREQDTSRDFSLHARKPLTLAEQQEYVVSALPNVGIKNAQQLLKHFGSIDKIAVASLEQLKEVEGIGDILAERIRNVFGMKYKKA